MRHYKLTSLTLIVLFLACLNLNAQELGIATPYSDSFQGRKTASGEAYDKNKLTGAHKELPFGTLVKVTRIDNKKSVTIRINDRGPYISGRVIEISRKAAERLDMMKSGQAEVKVEIAREGSRSDETVVKEAPTTVVRSAPAEKPAPKLNKSREPVAYDAPSTPKSTTKSSKKADLKLTEKSPPKPKAPAAKEKSTEAAKAVAVKAAAEEKAELVTGKKYSPYGLFQIEMRRPKAEGFGVQVSAVSSYEGMLQQIAVYQGKWFKNIMVGIEKGEDDKNIYKIILGSYETRKEANDYKKQLKKKKRINGFVVDLASINNKE